MEKGDIMPLSEIFGNDTQGRLIFDLVRAIVSDRMKITALEKLLIDKGIMSREELQDSYDEIMSVSSDDVINDVLQQFGSGNSDF
ncbi:MAG: hypothetical protein RIG61_11475 [Deltaproteobacteria bacterium]